MCGCCRARETLAPTLSPITVLSRVWISGVGPLKCACSDRSLCSPRTLFSSLFLKISIFPVYDGCTQACALVSWPDVSVGVSSLCALGFSCAHSTALIHRPRCQGKGCGELLGPGFWNKMVLRLFRAPCDRQSSQHIITVVFFYCWMS